MSLAVRCWTSAVIVVLILGKRVDSLQWTGEIDEGSTIPTCVGKNVSFPWSFVLDTGEAIQDISWTFQAQGGEPELIAVHRSGDFLPTEAFSQRVHFLTNAGLVLDHVTMADSGRYSVEVDVHNASKTFAKHEMTFELEVADFFQVSQAPEATYDNTTDSWHVQLKCGLFSSLDQPAGVTWMTPSGIRTDSTSYKGGYQYLQLPNPVEGGTYTCRLPPKSPTPSPACLPDDAPLSKKQPTFTVEEVKVRLTLLEAEKKEIKLESDQLKDLVAVLERKLDTAVTKLEAGPRRVAFFARLAENKQYAYNLPVIFDQVVTNQGDAYDPNTGEFMAPHNGTYFLAATSGSYHDSYNSHMRMKVGDLPLCSVVTMSSSHDTSSCNAVARLRLGQKVWMQSAVSYNYYSSIYTTFSGFLISAD